MNALNTAIAAAQAVYNNSSATQKQIDDALTALQSAVTTFKAAKIGGGDTTTPIGGDDAISTPAIITPNVDYGTGTLLVSEQSDAAAIIDASTAAEQKKTELKALLTEAVGASGIVKTDVIIAKLPETEKAKIASGGAISPLPLFETAATTPGDTAVVIYQTKLNAFAGKPVSSVTALKLATDGKTYVLDKASSVASIGAGQLIITDNNGSPVSANIAADTTYRVYLAIKDNSVYDWNYDGEGAILDPAILTEQSTAPDEGGSSGGCETGAIGLFGLAMAAVLLRKKAR
jgi:hypothetical protein